MPSVFRALHGLLNIVEATEALGIPFVQTDLVSPMLDEAREQALARDDNFKRALERVIELCHQYPEVMRIFVSQQLFPVEYIEHEDGIIEIE